MALPNPRALSLWILVIAVIAVVGFFAWKRRQPQRGSALPPTPLIAPGGASTEGGDPGDTDAGDAAGDAGDAEMDDADALSPDPATEEEPGMDEATDGIEGEGAGDAPK